MSGIAKIYGTPQEYDLLHDFLIRHKKRKWLKYLYGRSTGDCAPISNFGTEQDQWLARKVKKPKHSNMAFVLEQLKEQYSDSFDKLLLGELNDKL